MRDRAAHGAPVADLEVAYQRRCPGEERHTSRDLWVGFHGGIHCGRPDNHRIPLAADALEARDPPDIHQMAEVGEPEGEQRNQALAAREHLRAVTQLGEEGYCLLDAARRVVFERCGFQRGASAQSQART